MVKINGLNNIKAIFILLINRIIVYIKNFKI